MNIESERYSRRDIAIGLVTMVAVSLALALIPALRNSWWVVPLWVLAVLLLAKSHDR